MKWHLRYVCLEIMSFSISRQTTKKNMKIQDISNTQSTSLCAPYKDQLFEKQFSYRYHFICTVFTLV